MFDVCQCGFESWFPGHSESACGLYRGEGESMGLFGVGLI